MAQTPIERFNDASEEEQKALARILINEDFRVHGREMASIRRRNYAESLTTSNEKKDAMCDLIKERENDFLVKYNDPHLPDWFLRMEAQDVLMEFIHQRAKEEGLI